MRRPIIYYVHSSPQGPRDYHMLIGGVADPPPIDRISDGDYYQQSEVRKRCRSRGRFETIISIRRNGSGKGAVVLRRKVL